MKMDMYYKCVGRGSVLLLNATPDTTGLIPESHVAAYKEFGKEINHVILQEDLSMGQRVLAFSIEGLNEKDQWNEVYDATSIGHKRISKKVQHSGLPVHNKH